MKRKNIFIILAMLSLLILSVGCTTAPTKNVEQQETRAVQDSLEEASRQIGSPHIDDFFEKKTAKQIFELRDNSELVTYAYTTNLDGKFVYLGKAIGFGLPYSVQYTNPEKLVNSYGLSFSEWWPVRNKHGTGDSPKYTLPQADPNGLYMPEGLSATWLMLINEKTGEPEIIYTEPSIVVTQSKLPKRLVASWSLPSDY